MSTTPEPGPTSRALTTLEFVTKHFAVISTLAGSSAYFCTTVALCAYLAFFDWHLVWFIEISEILKIGLIAIVVLLTVFAIAQFFFEIVDPLKDRSTKERKKLLRRMSIGFGVVIVFMCVKEYALYAEPQYAYFILVLGALYLLALSAIIVGDSIRKFPDLNVADVVSTTLLTLLTTYALGMALAAHVRYSSDFYHKIVVKDRLMWAGLVFVTSRNTILYKDNRAFVVPNGDIQQIELVEGGSRRLRMDREKTTSPVNWDDFGE